MAASRLRLGSDGKKALLRLLSADELPERPLGTVYERAYEHGWKLRNPNDGAKQRISVIAIEKRFDYLDRFISVGIWHFPTVEAAQFARDELAESARRRWKNTLNVKVNKCEELLEDFPDARIVETRFEYHGRAFTALTVADVRHRSMVRIEVEGLSLNDAVQILRLQYEKLEKSKNFDGLLDDSVGKRKLLLPILGLILLGLASFCGYEISRHVPINADSYLTCKKYHHEFNKPVPFSLIPHASRSVITLGLKSNDSEIVDAVKLLEAETNDYPRSNDFLPGMLGLVSACDKIGIRH
jgi:hypothetical protein